MELEGEGDALLRRHALISFLLFKLDFFLTGGGEGNPSQWSMSPGSTHGFKLLQIAVLSTSWPNQRWNKLLLVHILRGSYSPFLQEASMDLGQLAILWGLFSSIILPLVCPSNLD